MLCPALGSLVQDRHGHTGASPAEGHQDGQGAGADIGGEAERAGLQKRRIKGDHAAVNYPMGEYGEGRAQLCLEGHSERMGGNRHKLPPEKF